MERTSSAMHLLYNIPPLIDNFWRKEEEDKRLWELLMDQETLSWKPMILPNSSVGSCFWRRRWRQGNFKTWLDHATCVLKTSRNCDAQLSWTDMNTHKFKKNVTWMFNDFMVWKDLILHHYTTLPHIIEVLFRSPLSRALGPLITDSPHIFGIKKRGWKMGKWLANHGKITRIFMDLACFYVGLSIFLGASLSKMGC